MHTHTCTHAHAHMHACAHTCTTHKTLCCLGMVLRCTLHTSCIECRYLLSVMSISKETYIYIKRDLHLYQKRPTSIFQETHIYVKYLKRPISMWKEITDHGYCTHKNLCCLGMVLRCTQPLFWDVLVSILWDIYIKRHLYLYAKRPTFEWKEITCHRYRTRKTLCCLGMVLRCTLHLFWDVSISMVCDLFWPGHRSLSI